MQSDVGRCEDTIHSRALITPLIGTVQTLSSRGRNSGIGGYGARPQSARTRFAHPGADWAIHQSVSAHGQALGVSSGTCTALQEGYKDGGDGATVFPSLRPRPLPLSPPPHVSSLGVTHPPASSAGEFVFQPIR